MNTQGDGVQTRTLLYTRHAPSHTHLAGSFRLEPAQLGRDNTELRVTLTLPDEEKVDCRYFCKTTNIFRSISYIFQIDVMIKYFRWSCLKCRVLVATRRSSASSRMVW